MKPNNLYIENSKFESVLDTLIQEFGLPKVYSILNIYSYNLDLGFESKVIFDRNHCRLEIPNLNNLNFKYDMTNCDIRSIHSLLSSLGYTKSYINQIFQYMRIWQYFR